MECKHSSNSAAIILNDSQISVNQVQSGGSLVNRRKGTPIQPGFEAMCL